MGGTRVNEKESHDSTRDNIKTPVIWKIFQAAFWISISCFKDYFPIASKCLESFCSWEKVVRVKASAEAIKPGLSV